MDIEARASHVFVPVWAVVRRTALWVAVVVAASVVSAPPAGAAPPGSSGAAVARGGDVGDSMPVTSVPARPARAAQSRGAQWSAAAVRWPVAGVSEVPVDAASVRRAGGGPVSVRGVAAGAGKVPVTRARVEVVDRARSLAAGLAGPAVRVSRVDGALSAGPVAVSIDYSGFAGAFGADWHRRLRVVRVPECALTTPAVSGCQTVTGLPVANDVAAGRLTVTVDAPPMLSSGQRRQAAPDQVVGADSVVLAVVSAGASPDTGTFARSSLQVSSSWAAGAGSGHFGWSYGMDVPPVPGDVVPDVELSYSSGAVDGRTNLGLSRLL